MKLILASASPRRRRLMRQAGYRFRIVPSHVSERASKTLRPARLVTLLAARKAIAIAKKFPHDVVLGADTLVFINGHPVGKPRDAAHAARILTELSGRWQRVYTGVALSWAGGRKSLNGTAVSYVKFRALTKDDIVKAAHKHLDKAGAYAVQERGDGFVTRIKGDYDNVVGLPMRTVKKLLRRFFQLLPKQVRGEIDF